MFVAAALADRQEQGASTVCRMAEIGWRAVRQLIGRKAILEAQRLPVTR
jgi:hypothetical protein